MNSNAWICLLGLLASCSSSSSSPGAAPSGPLACKQEQGGCTCTASKAKSGACPFAGAGPEHCCATVSGGNTSSCICENDPTFCENYATNPSGPICTCASVPSGLGSRVSSCAAPKGGHCCRSTTAAYCACGTASCMSSMMEVPECTLEASVLTCHAPSAAVSTCQ